MRHLMTTALVSMGLATSSLAGTAIHPVSTLSEASIATTGGAADATLWLAKDNGKAKGKPAKAKGQKKQKPAKAQKSNGSGNKAQKSVAVDKEKGAKTRPPGQVKKSGENEKGRDADWDRRADRVMQVTAPDNRNLLTVLGATALTLAAPGIVTANTPVEEIITYRNCPPGLAKKNPPCVPPGLAKKGVSQDDWLAYDDDEYDRIWIERRDGYLDRDRDIDRRLLLRSDQIATLYGLAPAPDGQFYALIDGMPVLLDQRDYDGLLLINQLAQVPSIGDSIAIAPTAALTQDELIRLYRLPQLQDGRNYAVLNGQVISLSDSEYETLQLIRIARAIL